MKGMKTNILFVANGDIDSDLEVIDAAARTAHGIRRASTQSRPAQVLRRGLKNIDAVIVDLDEHGHALAIVEALGCRENAPPVIALTNSKMAPLAYRHGATVCVNKPFSATELASVIGSVCAHTLPTGSAHPLESISIATPRASLREPPD